MYMLNCYSVELTCSDYLQLSEDEISDMCTFEYGIPVTEEMYLAIQPHRLRILPCGYKDGVQVFKAFFFGKEIVKDDDIEE